jgi:hypothetical protein
MSVTGTLKAKGRHGDEIGWAGRAGFVAQAALYAVIGALALRVALDGRDSGANPDKDGALSAIGSQPGGRVLLVVLAAGFAGFALWRLAVAIADRDGKGDDAKGLARRGGNLAQAIWYASIAVLALAKVASGGGGGGSSEKQATAGVLDWPGGRFLVAGAGAGFLVAAGWNVYRGTTCSFLKKVSLGRMGDVEERAARVVGVAGHLARAVAFGLIGLFLLKAAWQFDPKEARGLDGALLELSQEAWGRVLLAAVAVGFGCYALWALVQARYRET